MGDSRRIEPRYLNAVQAADYLGIGSAETLYQWVHRRQVPFIKHGRRLRFDRQDLDRLMAQQKETQRSA